MTNVPDGNNDAAQREACETSEFDVEFSAARGLWEQQRWQEAYNRLLALLARFPDAQYLNGVLAVLARSQGKVQCAITHMKALIQNQPSSKQASLQFVNLLAGNGLVGEAESEITRFLAVAESADHELLLHMITTLRQSGMGNELLADAIVDGMGCDTKTGKFTVRQAQIE